MELEHVVLRRLEYHSGTRDKPDMDILVQTKKRGMPVPNKDRLKKGQVVWLKWVGGPIVAKAKIDSWRGGVNNGDIDKIKTLTEGTGLFSNKRYWDDLKEKGETIGFIVIKLFEGEWLEQYIYPRISAGHRNWIYIDNEEERKAWLEDLSPGLLGSGKTISISVRFDVFRRDNFTCVYCGRRPPEVKLEIYHNLAKSRGGSNSPENLVTACWDCNRGKRDKPV